MPRISRHRHDLLATADAQMGLVTAAQLAALGVSTKTTSRRSAGGMWTRVLPGIHLIEGGQPSRKQRELAALLYAGDDSVLTGVTALRHHGMRSLRLQETADDQPERPEPVHVLIAHDRRRLSTGYVRIERTHRPPAGALRRYGLTIAPLPRAVGDAARRLRRPSDVLALVSEAVQRGLVDIHDLERELREGARRGSGLFRDAMSAVRTGVRSAPEGDLAQLLSAAGIRHVIYNASLVTSEGRFVAVADAWLDDVGVAIEVDSDEHHATGDGFRRTVRRNARYARVGVPVVTVLPIDLRDRPSGVVHDIAATRATAASRPRPPVHVSERDAPSSGREGWRWGA